MEMLEKAIRALVLINLREVDQAEQIKLLATAGYKPAEIGDLLEIKANTAAKSLGRARKAGKSKNASEGV